MILMAQAFTSVCVHYVFNSVGEAGEQLGRVGFLLEKAKLEILQIPNVRLKTAKGGSSVNCGLSFSNTFYNKSTRGSRDLNSV